MKRLAVICDLVEENWASMDLVAGKLLENLQRRHGGDFQASAIRPAMLRRFTNLPLLGGSGVARNADRLLNRVHDYPSFLKARVSQFDFFHVCDHSYAQLVHVLPPERTGVFVHDTDAFRSLYEPELVQRSAAFNLMARHILNGLQKAAVVFHTTQSVRRRIERFKIVDPARLVAAPYGVSPVFKPRPGAGEPAGGEPAADLPASLQNAPFVLHVGLCIPRKRVDVLLDVFAGLRARRPELRLLQVGGEWTAAQQAQIRRLGLGPSVVQLPRLKGDAAAVETALARIYRKAELIMMPSELEGFGLPVLEALACGRPVAASDIPSLREAGGDGAVYCPVGDIAAWVDRIARILRDPTEAPGLEARLGHARRFSWEAHTDAIAKAYLRLADGAPLQGPAPRETFSRPSRLAVIADMKEENWASMDLTADRLMEHLASDHSASVQATLLRPGMRRRFSRIPGLDGSALAFNMDRAFGRYVDYPRYLEGLGSEFDYFHVCDHSYAQLVHVLPEARTGVYLHDVDAFRSLIEPEHEHRSPLYNRLARHILSGLQKAALVFYGEEETRKEVLRHGLVDPARLVYAPWGVSPAFAPEAAKGESAFSLPAGLARAPYLLHVGLCIPRKRLDVVLDAFALMRSHHADLRLLQVGGDWTPSQLAQIGRLGIGGAVTQLSRRLGRSPADEAGMAALYRGARLVLVTSNEEETFSLPLVEGLACGRPVVASDIPGLRAEGGSAALYCPVGDIRSWAETACAVLERPDKAPSLEARLERARRFSWETQARLIVEAYQRLPV